MKKFIITTLLIISTLFLVSPILLYSESGNGSAQIYLEKITIPTYLLGPEDPNPPLWRSGVYPYPMQTEFKDIKEDIIYNAIIMENDYIYLIILPELGGRLLGAHDKSYNNEDFLYHNHVIKPALVGLRGAWLSGGIEWNFPTLGHTVCTVSPVHYAVKNNPDGSVTCTLGESEYVRGMFWSVNLTIYPDKSYIEVKPVLHNQTLTSHNGYFWSNAATHATDDCQVIFAPTKCVFTWGETEYLSWPIANCGDINWCNKDSIDISWYKNVPQAADFFCNDLGDFHGAYFHEKDCGTAHFGNRYDCPGKKFWTWGTARSGGIWEDILTDNDGQYIEIQAGRLLSMADSWIFEPHMIEQWKEYWYPLRKMGGFIEANPNAALNCEVKGSEVFLSLNVTKTLEKGTIELIGDEKLIYSEEIRNLTPSSFWNNTVQLESIPSNLKVIVRTQDGEEIINYEKIDTGPCNIEPPLPPKSELEMSAFELYNKGFELEKAWQYEDARRLYTNALKKDENLIPAHIQLGVNLYKSGDYIKALKHLNKAISLDRDKPMTRYYRALTLFKLGKEDDAISDLWFAKRRRGYDHLASYILGEINCQKGNWTQAEKFLRESLEDNPEDFRTRGSLVMVLRKQNKLNEAREILKELLFDNPIDLLANAENFLLNKNEQSESRIKQLLNRSFHDYLELSTIYGNAGLYREALTFLDLYDVDNLRENPIFKKSRKEANPLIFYYKGYYYNLNGDKSKALKAYNKGFECSPDYVFPVQLESFDVLNSVIRNNPGDWKAHYYLGNLLTAKFRWEEGLRSYLKAIEIDGRFSVLHRNIGQILWEKKGDIKGAIKEYEKAINVNADDYHLYVDLDHLYSTMGFNQERVKLLERAPEEVRDNFNVILQEAILNVHLENYTKAIQILKNNKFHPWEAWTDAHDAWVLANIGKGLSLINRGDYQQALEYFRASIEYPENLGTGAPSPSDPISHSPRAHYLMGLCYKELGDKVNANKLWKIASEEKVIREVSGSAQVTGGLLKSLTKRYYRGLALNKIGKVDEAELIFKELVERGSTESNADPNSLYIAGLGYLGLRDENKANRLFERALDKSPNLIEAKWQLNPIK